MTNRLIVAANRDGKSVFLDDGPAPSNAFKAVPGFDPALLWVTPGQPSIAFDGKNPAVGRTSVMPEIGGSSLFMVTVPPDSVMASPDFDPAAAGAKYMARIPGLAEKFEIDNPGMHRTETVDYDIVFDGEITLELDDGKCVDLKRGDVVVQYGTRHAWRNKGSKPATLIFVLLGARAI